MKDNITLSDLESLETLYRKIGQLNRLIEKYKKAGMISDTVRGEEASASKGRGRIITVKGSGHKKLPSLYDDLWSTLFRYRQEFAAVTEWLNNLPEGDDEEIAIKGILIDRYWLHMTCEETGEAWGYSASGISRKVTAYFRNQTVNEFNESE